MSGSTMQEGQAPAAAATSAEASAKTIVDAFWMAVANHPSRDALRRRVGDRWEAITWEDYGRAVTEAAAGLVELGVTPGDRVGILSANRVVHYLAEHFPALVFNLPPEPDRFPETPDGA